MLTETQRNDALKRLYNGEYPSQIAIEALGGSCATCGDIPRAGGRDGWMALQVVAPPGAPQRAILRQEYRYWQAVLASLDKHEYTLKCYNCSAIELRQGRMQKAALRTGVASKAKRVYVYVSPAHPRDLPAVMAWAENIPVEVFLRYENEVWQYAPREIVEPALASELSGASGYTIVKNSEINT